MNNVSTLDPGVVSSFSGIVNQSADSSSSDNTSTLFDSAAAVLDDSSSAADISNFTTAVPCNLSADSLLNSSAADSSSADSGFLSVFRSSKHQSSGKRHKGSDISSAMVDVTVNGSSAAPEWGAKEVSFSERAGRISTAHIIGFFLLFVALSIATVWLVNWFMRRRQQRADAIGADEELVGFVPRGADKPDGSASTTKVDVPSNLGSATSRGSEGNSSRQQFLQSRREAAQRNYGATDEKDTSEL